MSWKFAVPDRLVTAPISCHVPRRGQPLGPWSTRKNVIYPIFSKRFCRSFSDPNSASRHEPAFSLHESDVLEPELEKAIRSVSHLDLARVGVMTRRLHKLSNRKERTGRLLPISLRLGFVGQPFLYHARSFWQAQLAHRHVKMKWKDLG